MSKQTEFHYNIAEQFSRFPGGRLKKDGPYSGEEFREVLIPLFDKNDTLIVDLTGTVCYGSAFIDESFGELGKIYGYDEVKNKLKLIAEDDPMIVDIIWEKVATAAEEYKR